jgi:hypothetical protein
LRLVVSNEFSVATESGIIAPQIDLLYKGRDICQRRVVVNDVSRQTLRILFPEVMIAFDDLFG